MPTPATVTNTHQAISFEDAESALKVISDASSMAELRQGMALLGRAIALPNCVLLHLGGVDLQVRDVCHNLDQVDIEALLSHPLIVDLLGRPVPLVFPEGARGLGVRDLASGFAVVVPARATSCVLMFGRLEPSLNGATLSQQLGLATMAATLAIGGLQRFASATCPLTERELECLSYAAAGATAKETARSLGIDHRTVETHLARCREHLGTGPTLTAAVSAIRKGWLSHELIAAREAEIEISRPSEERRARKRRSHR